jgi:hypothetical protein
MPDRSPTLLDFGPHKELIKRELPMLRIEKDTLQPCGSLVEFNRPNRQHAGSKPQVPNGV